MLLPKTPRLAIGLFMFLVFLLVILLLDIPLGPDPGFVILLLMALFGAVTCSCAIEDDKRIQAELDKLRRLITPPETEEV